MHVSKRPCGGKAPIRRSPTSIWAAAVPRSISPVVSCSHWLWRAVRHAAVLTGVTNPLDGPPYPSYRLNAVDQGEFFPYGLGPNRCDELGCREALINYYDGTYYLYYDGAGPNGWLACLATSTNLQTWDRLGPALSFCAPGTHDSAAACSPWIIQDSTGLWHMYYLGTPNASASPDYVPSLPYYTLQATAPSPAGPWTKQYNPVPFTPQAGTYDSSTASPGQVVQQGNQYLMFFSAAGYVGSTFERTVGIATTTNLSGTWSVSPTPALPSTEQIENTSLYYQASTQTWFMFTNHVGAGRR